MTAYSPRALLIFESLFGDEPEGAREVRIILALAAHFTSSARTVLLAALLDYANKHRVVVPSGSTAPDDAAAPTGDGLPPPDLQGKRGPEPVYHFDRLSVGDSFAIDPAKQASVYQCGRNYRIRYAPGARFSVRRDAGGEMRCTRTA